MQLEIKRLALVLGGIALSLVFLLISLRQVDVASIKMAFFSLQYFPLIGCAAFLAAGVLIRSVRWRMLAGQSRQNQLHFYRATTLGVFANLIFPIRAGEIVRVYTLAKLTGSSYTVPLASALLDRLTDLFVLLLSAVIVYWFSPMTELLGSWMSFLFIGTSATLLIVIVYPKLSDNKTQQQK